MIRVELPRQDDKLERAIEEKGLQRVRPAFIGMLWCSLCAIDYVYDLPGPVGCVYATLLASGWLQKPVQLRVLAGATAAAALYCGYAHQADSTGWWTRGIVASLACVVFVVGARRSFLNADLWLGFTAIGAAGKTSIACDPSQWRRLARGFGTGFAL